MKSSIRIKLAVVFMALFAGTLITLYIINAFFLEGFYRFIKEKTLINIYNTVNDTYENPNESELNRLCQATGTAILITNGSGEEMFNHGTSYVLEMRLQDMIFGGVENSGKVIEQNESYTLQTTIDPATGLRYIEMWGMFQNNNYFIMQMAFESMEESAMISSQFLAYIGLLVMFISFILMYFITGSFTKPILELSNISRRMTNLDFDVKYHGERDDELGVLGDSINELSTKLEKTISELKTANNELERDLEIRKNTDEMRKEFLSNISHELKTPITLISGYAEGLKENVHKDREGMEYYCEVIMDEADKMNTIVQKLLTLNQIEFGDNAPIMERFDIVQLIQEVLESADIILKKKEITPIFNEKEKICVWADKFQVEEVLVNYLTNAINHVDSNKIIKIDIDKKSDNTRIRVYNSGAPIQEYELEKIWQKFYKVDKARTREYGGSGIGLSIVKAIMDGMKNDCGVNNIDQGVEFWFELDSKSYMD